MFWPLIRTATKFNWSRRILKLCSADHVEHESHCFKMIMTVELKAKHQDPGIREVVGICGTLFNL